MLLKLLLPLPLLLGIGVGASNRRLLVLLLLLGIVSGHCQHVSLECLYLLGMGDGGRLLHLLLLLRTGGGALLGTDVGSGGCGDATLREALLGFDDARLQQLLLVEGGGRLGLELGCAEASVGQLALYGELRLGLHVGLLLFGAQF